MMLIFRCIIKIAARAFWKTRSKARPVSLVMGHASHSLHIHTCLRIFF